MEKLLKLKKEVYKNLGIRSEFWDYFDRDTLIFKKINEKDEKDIEELIDMKFEDSLNFHFDRTEKNEFLITYL